MRRSVYYKLSFPYTMITHFEKSVVMRHRKVDQYTKSGSRWFLESMCMELVFVGTSDRYESVPV